MPAGTETTDFPTGPASQAWDDVRAWRKATREVLIGRRMKWDVEQRKAWGEQAKARLRDQVELAQFGKLGLYWPIRGEIDVRDIAKARALTGCVALPVVVEKAKPVEFWVWRPGTKMVKGQWNIPVPAEREVVMPDALIVPLVGFDRAGYRLGYGGGFYDRTLAAANPRPFCIGFGYESSRLQSVCPQSFDIPMDMIVTDGEAFAVSARAREMSKAR